MPSPTLAIARRLRLWTGRLVLLLVMGTVLNTWGVQGLIVPCQITGDSMAEALLGVHREVVCADCGHRFVCGSEARPVGRRAVCPNCGYADNDLASQPDVPGDPVLIHKVMFQLQRPRRWEVVAFANPHDGSKMLVKRVVGLPGESVQILHGDVYVDGQIQRKTLPQQRALAVLVHDAAFQPGQVAAVPPRWQNEDRGGRWNWANGRFTHPAGCGEGPIDWLTYGHWRRAAGQPDTVCPEPVTDTCGYNQTSPRRIEDVHAVNELMLALRLAEASGPGFLIVRASDGREEFQVRIEPEKRRYQAFHNDKPIPVGGGKLPGAVAGLLVEVSLFDQQLLVAFDARTAVTWPYGPAEGPPSPTSRPLSIGAQGLEVVVEDLRVYRDVYYTHPIGLEGPSGLQQCVHLGDKEYFVLGDNSAISADSRTWPEGPVVAGKLLVGKPLLVVFPARRFDLAGWTFQVPDLGRIRYIR